MGWFSPSDSPDEPHRLSGDSVKGRKEKRNKETSGGVSFVEDNDDSTGGDSNPIDEPTPSALERQHRPCFHFCRKVNCKKWIPFGICFVLLACFIGWTIFYKCFWHDCKAVTLPVETSPTIPLSTTKVTPTPNATATTNKASATT